MGLLGTIIDRKRREVAEAKQRVGEVELWRRVERGEGGRDFGEALRRRGGGVRVIAEFKRASPSAGVIRPGAEPGEIAAEYERSGAAAVSVLTDREFFDGDVAHLEVARARVAVPILRKDFVIDRYQVIEARAAGADAVLLIVAALDDASLRELHATAHEVGIEALVETHDVDEARRAIDLGARVIGVNHRDLSTLAIDMTLFEKIRPLLPAGTIAVAESGIRTRDDVKRLADAGADAILVGEQLMRQPSPGAALRELVA